jgi:hypothetical protein
MGSRYVGHGSLQMIFPKYYAWIPKGTRNDGAAFMKAYYSAKDEMNLAGHDNQQ